MERASVGGNDGAGPGGGTWLRPQSIVFTLLAEHALGRNVAIFSGSYIDALARVGVGEHATRSTLTRMARRGLLAKQRRGRKVYLRMTPRCEAILEDGGRRIWQTGAVNTDEVGRWTILTFSMPESWQRQRYDLRSRLAWAGFGPLQNGVWLAPAEVDVTAIVEELGLVEHVRVFHADPAPPTVPADAIRDAFDLDALAERYRSFLTSWEGVEQTEDPLALTLLLSTQWLRTIHDDPRVPVTHLPDDWPAAQAQERFRALHGRHDAAARQLAADLLEVIPAEG